LDRSDYKDYFTNLTSFFVFLVGFLAWVKGSADARSGSSLSLPTTANCTLHTFTQYVDHFTWRAPTTPSPTYQQRYYLCRKDDYSNSSSGSSRKVLFFYTGNEAPVDLYVNHTGLMWENAPLYNALMIFAEHRFYGGSQPCPGGWAECPAYLSVEQALADYAHADYAT